MKKLQTQLCLGNKNISLDWDWVSIEGVLNPNQPTSEELPKIIFWSCKNCLSAVAEELETIAKIMAQEEEEKIIFF